MASVSYTNIVSAFNDGEDTSLHSKEFRDMSGNVLSTAVVCSSVSAPCSVCSDITQSQGGGHAVGTGCGGEVYGASLEISQDSGEHVSCRNTFYDCDYSTYLL